MGKLWHQVQLMHRHVGYVIFFRDGPANPGPCSACGMVSLASVSFVCTASHEYGSRYTCSRALQTTIFTLLLDLHNRPLFHGLHLHEETRTQMSSLGRPSPETPEDEKVEVCT